MAKSLTKRLIDAELSRSSGSASGAYDSIKIKYGTEKGTYDIKLSFRRTVRVPDNAKHYGLPPDCGAFPLYDTAEYAAVLPEDIANDQGVVLPIYSKSIFWFPKQVSSLD
jgi:hypothetical protein